MLALRSILFNTLFYINLIGRMVVMTPIYFIVPRRMAIEVPKAWARSNHWLMKHIVGTTFEIEIPLLAPQPQPPESGRDSTAAGVHRVP